MADKVFVSPGVYTSEKDLSFVTRQVGVTTLGLVGQMKWFFGSKIMKVLELE